MKRWIFVLLIAFTFAVLGLKASSDTPCCTCDPNKPKMVYTALSNSPADMNEPNVPPSSSSMMNAPDIPPATTIATTAKVNMTGSLKFDPETVTIEAGQTVLWTNTSDMIHTVTANPAKAKNKNNCKLPAGAEAFDSGAIEPGKTYSQTFTVPGTYKYFCVPHETMGMTGKVIVNIASK